MLLKICLTVIVASISFPRSDGGAAEWGYYTSLDGPTQWCLKDPTSACCGHLQSPIALNHSTAKKVNFGPIKFVGYDKPTYGNVTDNGHSVVVTVNQHAEISGSHLNDTYCLGSFHFHWGKTDKDGSEHTIDGKHTPVECHFVHYNKKYGSQQNASNYKDGLAVIGVMLTPFNEFNRINPIPNLAFAPIIEALTRDIYENETVPLKHPITLSHLLPRNTISHFMYKGSLTTPPCSEIVTWMVLDHKVHISEAQLSNLRNNVHSTTKADAAETKEPLDDNFRPTQDSYNRVVYYNRPRSLRRFP